MEEAHQVVRRIFSPCLLESRLLGLDLIQMGGGVVFLFDLHFLFVDGPVLEALLAKLELGLLGRRMMI